MSASKIVRMMLIARTNIVLRNPQRYFSSAVHCKRKVDPSLPNLATTEEATKKTEIKRKAFSRMFEYIENYGERVLSNVLPSVAMRAVKLFSKGTKALFSDMKQYEWVNHVLSVTSDWQKACKTLTRKQLEVYLYLPGELMRVTPVLVLSAFPMAQNVVFPLALIFPRRLLSSHFYTEEVQALAFSENMRHRQNHFRPILRYMTPSITGNPQYEPSFSSMLNEREPNLAGIVRLKPLFDRDGPLVIGKLSAPHVKHLMKAHQVRGSVLWFPRFRLQQYANLVHQIDMAIAREGGPDALALPELKKSCHLRGLNVQDQDEKVMRLYLKQWMAITSRLDTASMSMLLHLPILLGYNHPSRIWDKSSVQ